MQQPEPRKYQLFPKERQLPVLNSNKAVTPDKAFAVAMSHIPDKVEKPPSVTAGVKARLNQHSLNRRRKVSVPELGPMTTVQEVSMDSRRLSRPLPHTHRITNRGKQPPSQADLLCMSVPSVLQDTARARRHWLILFSSLPIVTRRTWTQARLEKGPIDSRMS